MIALSKQIQVLFKGSLDDTITVTLMNKEDADPHTSGEDIIYVETKKRIFHWDGSEPQNEEVPKNVLLEQLLRLIRENLERGMFHPVHQDRYPGEFFELRLRFVGSDLPEWSIDVVTAETLGPEDV